MSDITKSGKQTYRDLQEENNSAFTTDGGNSYFSAAQIRAASLGAYSQWEDTPVQSSLLLETEGKDYFGNSRFDNEISSQENFDNINEMRAQNEGALSKLGAGLAKGVGLAATTFLDGTAGLLYGIGQGIVEKRWSGLWDNDISNALHEVNQEMEFVLPNYRTEAEQNRAWYQNLGTMNFWADGVLKNLGFTVGAFYSGSAWTKGLQAIGLIKGATSAQAVGSFLSALNEGRIEANNNSKDFMEFQMAQLQDARDRRALEIAGDDTLDDNQKISALKQLDSNMTKEQQALQDRVDAMGMTTLIGNTVLLSLDNMWQFGKLYSRGFENAKGLKGRIKAGIEREASEEIVQDAGKYVGKQTSKKRAIAKGLSNGLVEGNEEMAQAFISETAGNMQSYDSPDSYYKALTDPEARLQTQDLMTSIAKGFTNTYGNGDRWEEFAIGAFTGLLGMPTFGKVQNSDANTYLGKGKSVGLSGGVVGEYKSAMARNREVSETVNGMNSYLDKLKTRADYFVQSQSFTNAMDGWAEADNEFEYKNARNNEDFAAVSRFARAGKLKDLKDMINQDFENMSDERLADIARNTTPNVTTTPDGEISNTDNTGNTAIGGWRNTDGTLMSDTAEGRQQMREELVKKRDTMLNEIDNYEKSVRAVRASGNNSLSEDQVDELAWYHWKVKIFEDRYKSLKEEDRNVISDLRNTVVDYALSLEEADESSLSEDSKKVQNHMAVLGKYLDILLSTNSALELGRLVDNNKDIQKALEDPFIESVSGLNHDEFTTTMQDLQDLAKMGNAANKFNERYKEFIENPIKLIKNRQKIANIANKVVNARKSAKNKGFVENASVQEIVKASDNGDISLDDIGDLTGEEDIQQKINEAKELQKTNQNAKSAIRNAEGDDQAKADAETLLGRSYDVANSSDELLNLDTEALNDMSVLYDESMTGLTQEELTASLGNRLDAARDVLEQAREAVQGTNEDLASMAANPNNTKVRTLNTEEVAAQSTGHDEVEQPTPINELPKNEVIDSKAVLDSVTNSWTNLLSQNQDPTVQGATESVKSAIRLAFQLLQDGNEPAVVKETLRQQTAGIVDRIFGKGSMNSIVDELYTGLTTPKVEESQIEEDRIITPIVPQETVTSQIVAEKKRYLDDRIGEEKHYWKPTITELPIHPTNDSLPLYKLARTMKDDNGYPRFSESHLRRIEAVGEYLEQHGAYEAVDTGVCKPGDTIHFIIDKSLNEKAGATEDNPVILMEVDGKIVGDLGSKEDAAFKSFTGLPEFVERAVKEAKESTEDIVRLSESTTISKNMIGKVPYSSTRRTLREVFVENGQQVPFKLAIAMNETKGSIIMNGTAGRTKAQGQSEFDKSIMPPLNAKKGQPFLLLPTGNINDPNGRRKYVSVPVTMVTFSSNLTGTLFDQAVVDVVSLISTSDDKSAINIIQDLQELFALQKIGIHYKDDKVTITVESYGEDKPRTIYRGNKSDVDGQIRVFRSSFLPIQVSRKYINSTYKNGVDYNSMLGELMSVNLPIGTTHTRSEWFIANPINPDGTQGKAKNIKTTGVNPNAVQQTTIPTVKDVISYFTTAELENSDVVINPNNEALASTSPTQKGRNGKYVVTLRKPNYTRDEVINHMQGLSGEKYTDQKKKVLEYVAANSDWTLENIQKLIDDDKAATTYVLAHELAHQRAFEVNYSGSIYNKTNYMSDEAIRIEAEATIEGLDRLRQMKWRAGWTKSMHFASTFIAQDGMGLIDNLEQDFKVAEEDKEAIFNMRETVFGNLVLIPEIAVAFLNALKKGNPELYAKKKAEFLGKEYVPTEENTEEPIENSPISDEEYAQIMNVTNGLQPGDIPALDGLVTPVAKPSLEEQAKKAGILATPVNKLVWNALNATQQEALLSKIGPARNALLQKLVTSFDAKTKKFDEKKLGGTVESLLTGPVRFRETSNNASNFDIKSELNWLNKVLPQLSAQDRVKLVEGLTKMNGSTEIFGMFKDGIVYLNSTNQTRGTVYHEAFHVVFNTLLDQKVMNGVMAAARSKWGNLGEVSLEEKLAEDFRQYIEWTEYATPFEKVWRSLKRFINRLRGKETILDRLYRDINSGKYSRVQQHSSNNSRYREIDDVNIAIDEIDNEIFETTAYLERAKELASIPNTLEGVIKAINKVFSDANKNSVIGHGILVKGNRVVDAITKGDDGSYYTSKGSTFDKAGNLVSQAGADAVKQVIFNHTSKLGLFDRLNFTPVTDRAGDRNYVVTIKSIPNYQAMAAEYTKKIEELQKERDAYEAQKKELEYKDMIVKHYADYDRLSPEDQEYLSLRGIPRTEWEEMSGEERTVLMKCRV